MENFIGNFDKWCSNFSSAIWSTPMLILLLFVGILMTVGTKGFQISHLFHWMKSSVGSIFSKDDTPSDKNGGLSRFQALCTALASTIGTGNITGTATAIAMGGAGAVFWMWVSAFFGMMTAYSENVLGIYHRQKTSGGKEEGGPMYYIRQTFPKGRFFICLSNVLAVSFCVFCIFVSFGMGNMAQANSISMAFESGFGISPLKSGSLISLAVVIIIIGGTKRIGRTAEKLVPPMAIFYIICSLWIILSNYAQIPNVFKSIFSSAFSLKSACGAGSGLLVKHTVSVGFRRGLCSHEAGLGSAVFAHSSTKTKEPAVQGMMGIFVVFFDTIIICTLTAFVLLSTLCPSMTLEKALSGITKEPRIVSISNDQKTQTALMDTALSTHYIASDKGDVDAKKYTVSPLGSIPFNVYIKKEDFSLAYNTHTNIMSIRGISLDAFGEEIKDVNAPINAVKLEKIEGASLVALAFSQKFGTFAVKLLAVAIFLFAFSSIVGWSFYGLKAWQYLFKSSSGFVYKIIFAVCTFLGANVNLGLVWNLSDIFNGFMAIPNLISLIFLCPTVFKITQNYVSRKIKGKKLKPMLSIYDEKRKL